MALTTSTGPDDPTDSESKAAREKQDAAERLARSQDAGAMGNIEVAARNAGIAPENAPGTWQNQQREIKRFNDAEREAVRRDPGAMGRTDAAQLADARSAQQSQPPQQAATEPQQTSQAQQATTPTQRPNPIPPPPKLQTPQQPPQAKPSPLPTPGQSTVLQLPSRGFTLAERAWLEKLIFVIHTNRGIAGRNVSIDNRNGQVINASDSQPA